MMSSAPTTPCGSRPLEAGAAARFDRLDAVRGAALLWMAGFHFCFDLSTFGWLHTDFYQDPVWTVQRTCILSTFLLCAGAGQAVAIAQGQPWTRFWRRWRQIAACALAVSVGSWWMFPRSYIYFGVLHGMALMLIMARGLARRPTLLLPLGALIVVLPWLVQSSFFDTRATDWVGLVTHKPVTEDYVPIMPWLGVMLWGLWLGQRGLSSPASPLTGKVPRVLRPLSVLGRWSLTFYMVHQPLLIGGLQLLAGLRSVH